MLSVKDINLLQAQNDGLIKQNKDLQAENKDLKKYIERMDKPEIQVIDAEILTLKTENERLKREYDILDGIIDVNNAKIGQLEKENNELREKLQTNNNDDIKKSDEIFLLACKKNAYLQALQEIKEYINAQGIDNKWNMRIQRFRSEILQKITKAEEE